MGADGGGHGRGDLAEGFFTRAACPLDQQYAGYRFGRHAEVRDEFAAIEERIDRFAAPQGSRRPWRSAGSVATSPPLPSGGLPSRVVLDKSAEDSAATRRGGFSPVRGVDGGVQLSRFGYRHSSAEAALPAGEIAALSGAATIGMAGQLNPAMGRLFAFTFYRSLAQGFSALHAYHEAVRGIRDHGTYSAMWSIPVMCASSPNVIPFPVSPEARARLGFGPDPRARQGAGP